MDENKESKKKVQKKSVSYALKAFSGHIETLKDANLLTELESKQIEKIRHNAVDKYVKNTF